MALVAVILLSICVCVFTKNPVEVCRGARCVSAPSIPLRRPAVPYTIIGPADARNPVRDASRSAPAAQRCGRGECTQAGQRPTLTHMRDGAETITEESGPPSKIQLTCNVMPGSSDVPSEDALILQIHLAKGQEKLAEELRAQQAEVKQFQNGLKNQQGVLMAQQKEILDQQGRIFEQMEQVKAQYRLVMESVKSFALFSHYKDEEGHDDTVRPQTETHLQEAYTMQKVNMEATMMKVGKPTPVCSTCQMEEYCNFSGDLPRCEKCTVCLPGFFLVSQCSFNADRICQDRDECLEINNLCGEKNQCLNTPGGFRCTGMSVKDAAAGICGHGYYYDLETQECQACSECEPQTMLSPCSAVRDTVCSGSSEAGLSLSFSGEVRMAQGDGFPNMNLHIQGHCDGSLVSCKDGSLVLHQHGLIWVDQNLALRHGCRSFIQACLRLNSSEDGSRELSGVRMEQREGRSLQSTSISGVTVVDPGHILSLILKSASNHCSTESEQVNFQTGPVTSFSLFWVSHDTGAVAMTAHTMASAHYHTNYRPAFRISFISDPYMVTLSHDNRKVRFTEKGTVKFVLQQAIYSMGHACVSEGFFLLAYVIRNGSCSELLRVFKPGVHYRDTSLSLSASTTVETGDMLSFEILAPAQCSVRYFADNSGISMLSLIWIPSSVSAALSANISKTGLPLGAVRNKPLYFQQMTHQVPQMELVVTSKQHAHRNFIFRQAGTASVAMDLRMIYSCSVIELSLLQQGIQPKVLSRQIGGPMPEGSEWASVGLRASFPVKNGTEVFATVNCIRGRINQIDHEAGSSISIFWTASGVNTHAF